MTNRRSFIKKLSLGSIAAANLPAMTSAESLLKFNNLQTERATQDFKVDSDNSAEWPVLKKYDFEHSCKIALPIGGIGTGTISLGGIGNFQDFEIMNRPAKGYNPATGRQNSLFFTLYSEIDGKKDLRLLEGPVPFFLYEGCNGAIATNHGLPRFHESSFETAYPFGQVNLSTPQLPIKVKMKSFNPLIPGDVNNSSIPMALIEYEMTNMSEKEIAFTICGTMPNFIGEDGSFGKASKNKNLFKTEDSISGIHFISEGVDKNVEQWGEMTLVVIDNKNTSYRTAWLPERWGSSMLDFWDDLSHDGVLENRIDEVSDKPVGSIAASGILPPGDTKSVRFLLTWYFPNRKDWSTENLKNYYTTQFEDAWDVAVKTSSNLSYLENKTIDFVRTFCESSLPEEVKEAALFNVSTLRTQTCFRLSDGNFFAWEGCNDKIGCCFGSCTHVWNYETATAFLFGDLAKSMRRVEFGIATTDEGLMNFRVNLPYERIPEFNKVAADGQMGTIMKLYREWQLSGDDAFLKQHYQKGKAALAYAWKVGGWDGDQDGVMEGVQHNTMDVEYYGPNPQMTIWYLGALRAMEKMAKYMNDNEMSLKCRRLFESGSKWTDENLFNGEYYIHKLLVPTKETIPPEQLVGMGTSDYGSPDYQLLEGCLVDQLVGQYLAHICGLGYLIKRENAIKTLHSIMKYNYKENLSDHFNCFRTYALGDEAALLMASYPKVRPDNPFPYFTEVMTGFEYVAAIGMLQEGLTDDGLLCIRNIRNRYDGRKRSPFNEAECGHHYGRAMASWSAGLTLSGFQYSGIEKSMSFTSKPGTWFWSNGYAWGYCKISSNNVILSVLHGQLKLTKFSLKNIGSVNMENTVLNAGESREINVKKL